VEGKKEDPWDVTVRTSPYSFYHSTAAANKKAVTSTALTARHIATRRAIWKVATTASATRAAAKRAELRMITMEAMELSSEMQLADSGLDAKVLETALLGYHRLLKRGVVQRSDVLSICDFSQSSSFKRMYIIDVANKKLLYRCYVAHGISSGSEFANSFSNTPDSHKSSLGFYVTRDMYFGGNGLSLRIDGVDRGFNTLAKERNIVIHGAPYVSERILHKYGVMGTTFGCPAVPEELTNQIVPLLKGGTCFFIYYPSKKYLSQSSVLNG